MTAFLPNIDETLKLAHSILSTKLYTNGFVITHSRSKQNSLSSFDSSKNINENEINRLPKNAFDDLDMYPINTAKRRDLQKLYYKLISDLIKVCHLNYKLKKEDDDITGNMKTKVEECEKAVEKNIRSEQEIMRMAERLKSMQEAINNLKCQKESEKDAFNLEVANSHYKYTLNLKEMQTSLDKAVTEKNEMVLKYARSEKEVLDCKNKLNRLTDLNKQEVRLRDNISSKLKNSLSDLNKATSSLDEKTKELTATKRDLVREKEESHSLAVTLKWTQNKLSAEVEGHKDTRRRLENTVLKFSELKEEISHFGPGSSQHTPNTNHDRPPTAIDHSNSSTNPIPSEESDDSKELSDTMANDALNPKNDIIAQVELDILRRKHANTLQELENTKAKVLILESDCQRGLSEIKSLKDSLEEYKGKCSKMELDFEDAKRRLSEFEKIGEKLSRVQERLSVTEEANKDLSAELGAAQEREKRALEFTEGVSLENAKIAGEIGYLREKADRVTAEYDNLVCENVGVKKDLGETMKEFEALKARYGVEKCVNGKLNTANNALSSQLGQLIEDHRNEIKALKKKYLVCSKDLANHLKSCPQNVVSPLTLTSATSLLSPPPADWLSGQTSTSKNTPPASFPSADHLSSSISNDCDREDAMSRVSSFSVSSLAINTTNEPSNLAALNDERNHHNHSQANANEDGGFEMVEDPNSSIHMMVEKTLRLQKSLARKKDKIEFLNDHVVRLQDEVHKKAKIIQTLLLHEKSGALTTEEIDGNKALMAQKSGVMASIFNPLKVDRQMTLDLSLEINKKLQSLLEDSLLKIIVLKEGMENLGREISRLLQENKELEQKISPS